MKLINAVENYTCRICGKPISKLFVLTRHIKLIHKLNSIFQYFYFYDPENLLYGICPICGKERSLESYLDKPNSITCSKECDYKNKVKSNLKNYGANYYKDLCKKMIDSRTPEAFSKSQKKYWLNKGFSVEEALKKVSEFNRRASPRCLEFYDRFNLSEKEAEEKISFLQKSYSPRCVEYWIKRGFSVEEAEEAVSDFQKVVTIERFIERHGILEGNLRYSTYIERIKKGNCFTIQGWMKKGFTFEESLNKIKEIQSKAHFSMRVLRKFEKSLIPILKVLKEKFEYQKGVAIDDSYIGVQKYHIILDYYLPQYNLNIEMDGFVWHNKEEDELRDNYLIKKGMKILRIPEIVWNSKSLEQRIQFLKEELCGLKVLN